MIAVLPKWVDGYIGIPYELRGVTRAGCDCWGLVRLIFKEVCGIELNAHGHIYDQPESRRFTGIILASQENWVQVPVSAARTMDVVMFHIAGHPCHLGLVVQPPMMLHSLKQHDSVLERYDSPIWSRRVGVYRARALV